MELIVMVGISGSGKTTYAKELINDNTILLSADNIREELYGDASVQGDGNEVFSILMSTIKQYLSSNYNIIVDNTNVTTSARQPLLDIAKIFNATTTAIYIPCTVGKAMFHQEMGRDRRVPRVVIQRQFDRLEQSKASLLQEFDRVIVKE